MSAYLCAHLGLGDLPDTCAVASARSGEERAVVEATPMSDGDHRRVDEARREDSVTASAAGA
jgi:hypothetical protein